MLKKQSIAKLRQRVRDNVEREEAKNKTFMDVPDHQFLKKKNMLIYSPSGLDARRIHPYS